MAVNTLFVIAPKLETAQMCSDGRMDKLWYNRPSVSWGDRFRTPADTKIGMLKSVI